MRRSGRTRWGRLAALGVGAVLATSLTIAPAPVAVDAAGWQGFAVTTAPSVVGNGASPSWGLGVTTDLGGPGVDVWNNNHGSLSEALVDVATPARTSQTAIQAGDPTTVGPDTHGVAFTDIDGDGDEDLFELMGRNNDNRLFRNDSGTLRFVDAGGLEDGFGRGRQPLFVDFDRDGDMDAIITNLDLRSDPVPQNERQLKPSEIYLNNGNGTRWTKVPDPGEVMSDGHIRIAQLTTTGPGTDPIIVTHDVFNLAKDSIAIGTGAMAEPVNPATPQTDTSKPIREVIVGDFDNDLYPEFIVFVGSEARSGGTWPMLAHEVSAAGAARTVSLRRDGLVDNCRSGAAADFDNDGDLDILAGCAQRQEGQTRNIVLLNDGRGNFSIGATTVLPATIAETPGAIVVADLDQNGWMDAFVANGYDFDQAPDHVYTNRGGTTAHWLSVDLESADNPDALGAQVFVGTDRWQVRESGHRYHRSQDGRDLHFGLGSATSVAPVLIRWPNGGVDSCVVAGIDRRVTIRQGSASCTPMSVGALLAALDVSPTAQPAGTCAGRIVTVDLARGQRPTNGDDVILGSDGADVIDALDGDDIICGLGGDDQITSGGGADTVYAGAGNDVVWAGGGHDRVFGDGGNDVLRGSRGRDLLRGGDGKDRLWGQAGHDFLYGDAGHDTIIGQGGNDLMLGGDGRDDMWGIQGNDRMFGGGGADTLRGGGGTNTLDGGESTDACFRGSRVNCES